jgi:hypothetical protein
MGLKKRVMGEENSTIYQPGSGVLAKVGSARDGNFLKAKSGQSMSVRASRLAQQNMGERNKANILKPRLAGSQKVIEV